MTCQQTFINSGAQPGGSPQMPSVISVIFIGHRAGSLQLMNKENTTLCVNVSGRRPDACRANAATFANNAGLATDDHTHHLLSGP